MFDSYIGIDWSGAASPVRSNKIALARCDNSSGPSIAINKNLSRTDIFDYICDLVTTKGKHFIGIDCNFGFCFDVGQTMFGEHASFRDLWQEVERLSQNEANLFAGPFWKHHKYADYFWVSGKQPSWFDLNALRRKTEIAATQCNLGIPESPFKLIGAKQVGKGGLAGMRLVHALKQKYADKIAIWPFENALCQDAAIVISEIYPRLFIRHAGYGNQKVKEYETLEGILTHFDTPLEQDQLTLNDHLTDAIISAAGIRWFHKNKRPLNTSQLPGQALGFEGWIFGVDV